MLWTMLATLIGSIIGSAVGVLVTLVVVARFSKPPNLQVISPEILDRVEAAKREYSIPDAGTGDELVEEFVESMSIDPDPYISPEGAIIR